MISEDKLVTMRNQNREKIVEDIIQIVRLEELGLLVEGSNHVVMMSAGDAAARAEQFLWDAKHRAKILLMLCGATAERMEHERPIEYCQPPRFQIPKDDPQCHSEQ